MSSIFNFENLTALGLTPLWAPHLIVHFSKRKNTGMHVSLFLSVFSWFWVAFSANAAIALFGLTFLALSSVVYLISVPNRKDFSVVTSHLFLALYLSALISIGGFSGHEFGWASWVARFEANTGYCLAFLAGAFVLLLGQTEEKDEGQSERFSLIYFWPQAICLQFLSRIAPHLNGSWVAFVLAALYVAWALIVQPKLVRRRNVQNAIYIFSIGCVLSGLQVFGQVLFLALSLPNLFLNDFELSKKNRWAFFALVAVSSGLVGFVSSGSYLRVISELWDRPHELVAFSLAITIIQIQLWIEFFKFAPNVQEGNKNGYSIIYVVTAILLQLGVFLTGTWSGRFFQSDPDFVWHGLMGQWSDLGEKWNESVGILCLQVVVSLALAFVLKNKNLVFRVGPIVRENFWRYFALVSTKATSFAEKVEKRLVFIENLDGEIAKMGVVSGRFLQLVLNGSILRGLLVWITGLVFLFLHYYRA